VTKYMLCPKCVSPTDNYDTTDKWWCDSCGEENDPQILVSWSNGRWVA